MKLTRLGAQNFLGLEKIDIDLSTQITMIQGKNGSGKSSVRDAILYALTGRARSTDAAGRGADRLVRVGTLMAGVSLGVLIDGNDWVIRRWRRFEKEGGLEISGPSSPPLRGREAEAWLASNVPPADVVESVLDMPHFFSLGAGRQSELLSGALQLSVSKDDLCAHAQDHGLSALAWAALDAALGRQDKIGLDALADAHRRAYERRKELRKEIDTLERTIPSERDVSADRGQFEIAETAVREQEEARGKSQEELGRLQSEQHSRERMTEELAAIQRQIKSLPEPSDALPLAADEVGPMEEAFEKARETFIDEKQRAAAALEDKRKAEGAVETLEAAVEAARSGSSACPSVFAPQPCQYIQQQTEKLPELDKQLKAAMRTITRAESAHTSASLRRSEADERLNEIGHRLRKAKEAQARQQGTDAGRRETLETREAEIRSQLDAAPDHGDALKELRLEIVMLTASIDTARAEIARTQQAIEASDAAAKTRENVEALAKKFSVLDELVPALDPKGIPARITAHLAGDFIARLGTVLEWVTGDEYRVDLVADKGVRLDVYRTDIDPTSTIPPENLSASERLRLGIALAAALSDSYGLRVLVADEVDLLDQEHRAALSQAVVRLAGIESVVLLATADAPAGASSQTVARYWMADGTAEFLDAETVARYWAEAAAAKLLDADTVSESEMSSTSDGPARADQDEV